MWSRDLNFTIAPQFSVLSAAPWTRPHVDHFLSSHPPWSPWFGAARAQHSRHGVTWTASALFWKNWTLVPAIWSGVFCWHSRWCEITSAFCYGGRDREAGGKTCQLLSVSSLELGVVGRVLCVCRPTWLSLAVLCKLKKNGEVGGSTSGFPYPSPPSLVPALLARAPSRSISHRSHLLFFLWGRYMDELHTLFLRIWPFWICFWKKTSKFNWNMPHKWKQLEKKAFPVVFKLQTAEKTL